MIKSHTILLKSYWVRVNPFTRILSRSCMVLLRSYKGFCRTLFKILQDAVRILSRSCRMLRPSSHMEVGCPGTWGTGTAYPRPKQSEHPRAHPTCNPATNTTLQKNPEPAPTPTPVTLNWKNGGKLTE